MTRVKNCICYILAFVIVAFICDTDRVEQGRFMDNVRNIICDMTESLSVATSPIANTDAIDARGWSHSEASGLRLDKRHTEKDGRSCELLIFLALLVSILYLLRFRCDRSFIYTQSCEAVIINYIRRQDGKK